MGAPKHAGVGGRAGGVDRRQVLMGAAGLAGLPLLPRSGGSLGERRFHAPVTVFVGENGMGKSTLLEAVAVALGFNAEEYIDPHLK